MNVLILTPDGVGSTILQRITTLALYLNQKDVVNCHELTNGLIEKDQKIYKEFSLNYSQTLEDIVEILKSSNTNTSLVSRLAKYHLDYRKDTLDSQKNFYKFLKEFNNKILVCQRKNLFEYAMSWSIRNESNILNVYKKEDRIAVKNIGFVNSSFFIKKCQDYVKYLEWIDEYFKDYDYDIVYYEDFAADSDRTIESLFNINSNIFKNAFGEKLSHIFQKEYLVSNRIIPLDNKEMFLPLLKYKETMMMLEKKLILPPNIAAPIKNTTLQDKKNIVKNFDECRELFLNFSRQHNWIDISNIDYDFWNKDNIK